MIPRIGLDLDGVFADFNTTFAATLANVSGRALIPEPWTPTVWDWPQAHGYTAKEIAAAWHAVDDDPLWWSTLTPYPQATTILQALNQLLRAQRIAATFLIARPSPTAHWQSVDWLRRYGIDWPQVCITKHTISKGLLAKGLHLDLLVDDSVDNLLSAAELKPGILLALKTMPYNARPAIRRPLEALSGVTVCDTLGDVLTVVTRLAAPARD
jgi:uncharacterized HAD superfamily protein